MATFLYVIKACPIWLKFKENFSKRYRVDSWKIVSKIKRTGQLFTTYKKDAIPPHSSWMSPYSTFMFSRLSANSAIKHFRSAVK